MAILKSVATKLEPDWSPSQLTAARPDIWARGVDLASGLTGIRYVEKLPLADGTIFACGGYDPGPPLTRKEKLEEKIKDEQQEIAYRKNSPYFDDKDVEETEARLKKLKKKLKKLDLAVLVPSGAMEWLLHEVGHWIAASDSERLLPNYGNPGEVEEVAAWAFEEAVLSEKGPARLFAPPTQRDGEAFVAGPIPDWAFRRIDKRMIDGGVSVEPFRNLWAEWVDWGREQGDDAPWLRRR